MEQGGKEKKWVFVSMKKIICKRWVQKKNADVIRKRIVHKAFTQSTEERLGPRGPAVNESLTAEKKETYGEGG